MLLSKRFAQRRQRRPCLRQCRFLGGKIAAIGVALVELLLERVAHFADDGDEPDGGIDLPAQRRFGNDGNHQIGCQREIGRLDLKALYVRQSFKRLDGPAIEAPDVECVGHR